MDTNTSVCKEDYSAAPLVYHRKNQGDYESQFHYHDQFEIFYCVEGDGHYIVEGTAYPLEPRSLFVLGHMEIHKPEPVGTYQRYILFVDVQFLSAFIPQEYHTLCDFLGGRKRSHKIILTPEEDVQYRQSMDALIALQEQGALRTLEGKLRYALALTQVVALFRGHTPAETASRYVQHPVAEQIIHYINAHYTEEFSLDALAQHLSMNKNYLCTIFKRVYNTTILQYVITKKLSHAKVLLAQGESIQTICYQCGFNEYTHFIRTFTKHFGLSPNRYRTLTRGG